MSRMAGLALGSLTIWLLLLPVSVPLLCIPQVLIPRHSLKTHLPAKFPSPSHLGSTTREIIPCSVSDPRAKCQEMFQWPSSGLEGPSTNIMMPISEVGQINGRSTRVKKVLLTTYKHRVLWFQEDTPFPSLLSFVFGSPPSPAQCRAWAWPLVSHDFGDIGKSSHCISVFIFQIVWSSLRSTLCFLNHSSSIAGWASQMSVNEPTGALFIMILAWERTRPLRTGYQKQQWQD